MDLTVPNADAVELAAAFFQAGITVGLAVLCWFLYRKYRKPYFASWALAWSVYALRLGAIVTFLVSGNRVWLYWHQVATGWTALAFLWAALVFSQDTRWRHAYGAVLAFPPLWSYVAIYQLDNFLLAAGPAVLFLSAVTIWTGWLHVRHQRHVQSTAAALMGGALFLWGLHHLDYPFLRARGAWVPWGYYLDIVFELVLGAGILLLVLEDLHRGVGALSAMTGALPGEGRGPGTHRDGTDLEQLLVRALGLPAVRGGAMYLREVDEPGRMVAGVGECAGWVGRTPSGSAARALARVVATGQPEIVHDWTDHERPGTTAFAYAAALPVIREGSVHGVMVIVGDARDPFAALDTAFLVALGRQVGAALENADLYRRLENRTAELERLATRMVQHHEDERRRLSRELHDETAQVFSAVRLQLGVVRESAERALQPRLDRVLDLVDTGIQSIRNVTNDLRPSLLDDLGLLPALRALVDDFGGRAGLETTLVAPSDLPPLSPAAELAVFRAVQEGLANVARHAQAHTVGVEVGADNGTLRLVVRDDGIGFPSRKAFDAFDRPGHMGLAGMRERITALGGTVAVDSADGAGASLCVTVPTLPNPGDLAP